MNNTALPLIKPGKKYRFETEHELLQQSYKSAGIELMAMLLAKSEKTIRGELVPSDSGSAHKVGFDDGLSAIYVSGDISALVKFLDRLDYIVIKRDEAEEKRSLENLSLEIMGTAGSFNTWLSEALSDHQISQPEWEAGRTILNALERQIATANRNK